MPAEAVLRALAHVWRTLEPFHKPMALMGGLALAAWKHVRATRDVDLLLGIGETELEPLLESLCAARIRTKRQPAVQALGSLRIAQLLYEPPDALLEVQIDLLLGDSDYHREALARRTPADLPGLGVDIFVLSCEDLVIHKLLAGRVLDRVDAAALLRANRTALDLEYLARWADRLDLSREFAEVRSEALPAGDPPPAG